ncbi:MAG TPA: IS66 family transposase [Bradyrhizobium sp.]|uniref:IS66 family transposase n=1 Tax=Bradyrhizobium sp. TaxID=376 RepID=UPI002BA649B6|nr:IS66 family transposase [Bradyrhizobium sp.]HLZ05228.1 IS66 family transposase [Bradyrhizobium sp.]
MAGPADHLPDGTDALKAALVETRAKLVGAQALIEHLQLVIAKMQRDKFGPRSERSQRLIDQLELQLEELVAAAGEDEAKAETKSVEVRGFTRRSATRRNFPADLPRRRVVHAAPTTCPCCGGSNLSKIGEDVTETLDVVPRQWFVTEHVREKFSCRSCETITQPPAPFHAIARGFAGPSLLAMMLVEKYANHQPLNRQSEQYAREGIELSVSTMADHVGACAATLMPLHELIKAHVFAAERLHGDDTTVPVLEKGKCRTGRIWTYVRDDRPFGGRAPPAAVFFYSSDRAGIHPEQHLAGYAGILQADAYGGFNALYAPDRKGGPITQAGCWAHARRKLFELADIASKVRKGKPTTISPIAFEAVQKFDAIFALERSINGSSPEERLAARRKDIAPLVHDLIDWMKRERGKLSRHNDVAKAFDYMLKRIDAFTRFLEDGRICVSNNAAERALRGIALGRKSWLFAGSDRGGARAAVMLTLIQTAKLNEIDPQAWLADVLARINDHKIQRLDELLPWNWNHVRQQKAAA